MASKKFPELRRSLAKAISENDEGLRRIKIAAVLTEALGEVGITPILVGGAAVAFYTDGRYVTQDIDMIAATTDGLVSAMAELGFSRLGKDFVNDKLDLYVEFPSDSLGPTEVFDTIKVGRTIVRIISIEDLLVDRLAAYKFWRSEIDGLNALRLLEVGGADRTRVEKRAREEDVLDALDHVERVLEQAIRKKLPPDETNALLKKFNFNSQE